MVNIKKEEGYIVSIETSVFSWPIKAMSDATVFNFTSSGYQLIINNQSLLQKVDDAEKRKESRERRRKLDTRLEQLQ